MVSGALTIAVGNGTAVNVGAAAAAGAQTTAGQTAGSAYDVARTINAAGVAGVTAEANTSVTAAWTTTTASDVYTINGTAITIGSGATNVDLVAAINQNSGATGVQVFCQRQDDTDGSQWLDISLAKTTGGTGGLGTATGATENNTANSIQTFDVAGTYVSVGTVILRPTSALRLAARPLPMRALQQERWPWGQLP